MGLQILEILEQLISRIVYLGMVASKILKNCQYQRQILSQNFRSIFQKLTILQTSPQYALFTREVSTRRGLAFLYAQYALFTRGVPIRRGLAFLYALYAYSRCLT